MSDQTRLFKILTLNLWHDNLPSANRERAQRDLIEGLSPDVIGFQEVLRDGNNCQATDLVSDLGYEVAYGEVVPFWKRSGVLYGNAIASRLPFLKVRNYPLSSGGSSERRAVIFVEIDYVEGSIFAACTHLHHRSSRVRSIQAKELISAYDIFLNDCGGLKSNHNFVLGDLNSSPGKEVTAVLEPTFLDAFETAGKGLGLTWSIENPYAKVQNSSGVRIDYIWSSKNSSAIVNSCQVVGDTAIDGVYPSDHFGVFASFIL
tara:strand:+ start:3010 stop:3789 length:780 start_codon:yes stop_codon:yes gene_type:complete